MTTRRERKTYVMGDIHGCFIQFKEMINNIDFRKGDKLILLGDYIDRGEQSYEVVKEIQRLQREHGDNVIALKGNHEQMLIDTYYEMLTEEENGKNMNKYPDLYNMSKFDLWLYNSGRATIESYLKNNENVFEDIEWFESLLPYYEDNNYIYVHGGLRPYVSLGKQEENDLLWIREEFHDSKYDWGKKVIFGHTPYDDVRLIGENKIGIDTGCVFKNKLSCLSINEWGQIDGVYEVLNYSPRNNIDWYKSRTDNNEETSAESDTSSLTSDSILI